MKSKKNFFLIGGLFLLGGLSFYFTFRGYTQAPILSARDPKSQRAVLLPESGPTKNSLDGRRREERQKSKVFFEEKNPQLSRLPAKGPWIQILIRGKKSKKPIPKVRILLGKRRGDGFRELGKSNGEGQVRIPMSLVFSKRDESLYLFGLKKGYGPISQLVRKKDFIQKDQGKKWLHWWMGPGSGVGGNVFAQGKPVETARLYLYPESGGAGRGMISWSRRGGFFLINGIAGKSYNLIAHHSVWGLGKAFVTIPRDGTIPFLKISLFPVSSLMGKIVSPDGLGIPGIEIFLSLMGPGRRFDNVENGATIGNVYTKKDGTFKLLGLHPGSYRLTIPGIYNDEDLKKLRKKVFKTDQGEQVLRISSFIAKFQFFLKNGKPLSAPPYYSFWLKEETRKGRRPSYRIDPKRDHIYPHDPKRFSFSYYGYSYLFFRLGSTWKIHFFWGDLEGDLRLAVPRIAPPYYGKYRVVMQPRTKTRSKH